VLDDLFEMSREGAVVRLSLARPDRMNPIGLPGDAESAARISAQINADISIKCVILTGTGKAFCAGGDLKAMRDKTGSFAGTPAELRTSYRSNIHRIVDAIFDIEVPTIAAINGAAIGLGCDVACACDVRIASEAAIFSVPFLRIGLIPGDGGSWLLPRAIGMQRASQLLFTGQSIDAATASAWGLVSETTAPANLLYRADQLASLVAAQPSSALRLSKMLLRQGEESGRSALMEMSAMAQAIAHHTWEHEEGVTALLEKRAPSFADNED
jgi:enoyl-CoA hydratase/carnithine racemase